MKFWDEVIFINLKQLFKTCDQLIFIVIENFDDDEFNNDNFDDFLNEIMNHNHENEWINSNNKLKNDEW